MSAGGKRPGAGRPKGSRALNLLAPTGERMAFYGAARQYDQKALQVMASILMDENQPASLRLAAAKLASLLIGVGLGPAYYTLLPQVSAPKVDPIAVASWLGATRAIATALLRGSQQQPHQKQVLQIRDVTGRHRTHLSDEHSAHQQCTTLTIVSPPASDGTL
jgi:hypothetical protein